MKKFICFSLILIISAEIHSQSLQRPKLVVGIVVDQMRWDYLYRYYDRYAADGGFRRLLRDGFSCENTMIPYVPTMTAPGHSCIYTGSVPAINGIVGNNWWDNELRRQVYCTEDKSVKTVGSNSTLGEMSPCNLLTTTIGDELKLATNFRSKVIGIGIKDRGSILCAGHSANAAYWYDNTNGNWISSTYYMDDLPGWVKDFNSKKLVDKYYQEGWNTMYPINTYTQSTEDENPFEGKIFGADANKFPYDLKKFIGNNYHIIISTPHGNTLTTEFVKSAINFEQLGADNITDFLAVGYASSDLVGHAFGPNSIEQEDCFLRLDKELADLMNFMDKKIGKGQYLLFLSADHGVAHVPTFLKENKIPSGNANLGSLTRNLNQMLNEKFNRNDLVYGIYNSKVTFNRRLVDSLQLNMEQIKKTVIDYLSIQPFVARVIDISKLTESTLTEKEKKIITNSYYPMRNGDIHIIIQPQWLENFSGTGTTHGTLNSYDTHIPLLWYGWGIKPGKLHREVYMTDIAPTLAALLHIQEPSGSVGHVINEITD